jgi:tRNA (cmo5U34)-methyltransferase
MKDQIFSDARDPLVKFTFDKQVAAVFPDMITRSVPGYSTIVAMIGVLTAHYAKDGSNCYDLGSSLGAVTLAMLKHTTQNVKIFAIDNSVHMVEKSKKIIGRVQSKIPVEVLKADILDVTIEKASVVVLNFTLQFLSPDQRTRVVEKIYQGLNSKGVLIISEKICFNDTTEHTMQNDWHLAFKKANGYSDLEIAQKRTALENVLIPESEIDNINRLKQAGFKEVYRWFQCINFISLIARK